MAAIISILIILAMIWFCAAFQLSIFMWTACMGITLLLVSLWGGLSIWLLAVCWIGYLAATLFAHLHTLRQRYMVRAVLSLLQKQIPVISETERIAMEAGHTWWEKELFCGRPKWDRLFSMPSPTLTHEEQDFLDHQVERVCRMLDDWQIMNETHDLSPEVWAYFKKEKFFGMVIPKEYGGLGFSALMHSTVVVKLASRCISAAVNAMVPNSLGPGELLVHYGTPEQKSYYLPRLAAGEDIPCFALTGPDAGSDAGAMTDYGIICYHQYDGKETLGIRLNWNKRYITLAPVATLLGLAFQLYDPNCLLGHQEEVGITLCLIPTSHPGVEIGHRHYPMHLAFMNGPTRGRDVFIPIEWIIGGKEMAGQGWRMLMECLSIGRSISLPALATACGKVIYRQTGAYARVRKQFNTAIAHFEGVEEALGQIAGLTYMAEATRIMTAGAVDQKINPSIASAIAKYHLTEMSRVMIARAMDIHAGQAIQMGPRNKLAHVHLAIPISITVEGANILTRNLIIFGQGATRCHPYLLQEVALLDHPTPNIPALDKVLMQHIGFFISNVIRVVGYSITAGKWIRVPSKNKVIKKWHKQLTRMSAALAVLADMSLILLGGSLKRHERISARLGDMMSQLYIASAVLKYFHDNQSPDTDVDYVSWSLQHCLHQIQVTCDELLYNFPQRWLGVILRWLIFPYGKAYYPPCDALNKKIVAAMLIPSDFRERLTRYCYISKNPDDTDYRLEKALAQITVIDSIDKKLHRAIRSGVMPLKHRFADQIQTAQQMGILTADEAEKLSQYEALREEIIKVNEFSFDLTRLIA